MQILEWHTVGISLFTWGDFDHLFKVEESDMFNCIFKECILVTAEWIGGERNCNQEGHLFQKIINQLCDGYGKGKEDGHSPVEKQTELRKRC